MNLNKSMAEPALSALNVSGLTSRSSHRQRANFCRLRLTRVGLATTWLSAALVVKADFLTLPADQDAFAASYGTNYSNPELDVGYRTFVGPVTNEYRAAIRFPLPPSLNTAVIDSAHLKLFYFDHWGSQNMRLVRVQPLLENWTGADQFFNALRGAAIAEAWVGPAYRWIEWDVTAAARTWATNPSQNFGLMLVADPVGANDNAFRFHSREAADPAVRPVLEIRYYLPPQITLQPQSQTVAEGSPVTLTVAATGSPTLDYEWWRDGQRLTNVLSTNVLTINSVRSTDAGVYSVVVRNLVGSVQSSNATIMIASSPAELSVRKSGPGMITVEWSAPASTLQVAPLATGPWSDLPEASSPYETPIPPMKYFRLKL